MYNAPVPPPDQLPSTGQLLRSTALAIGVAVVILVTLVLPAEYGVDPTGVGDMLGLRRMGEIKVALAIEAEAAAAAEAALSVEGAAPPTSVTASELTPVAEPATATRADTVEFSLQPGEGREFKLVMEEGASVDFSWATNAGVVNFDTHGDPPNPPAGFYHGYERGTGVAADEGVLTAAFDGLHGWFWRNRGDQPVTVTLRVEGAYDEVREIR